MPKKRGRGESTPPPPPQPIPVHYEAMPDNHKKKFYLYDDSGTLKKFVELISWLRTLGCADGSVFEDIPNLHWSGNTYPLVEIEVFTPQDNSAKFLIAKKNLYVIAFLIQNGRFQLRETGFQIHHFLILSRSDTRYTNRPWEKIGPQIMIDAINTLASAHLNVDQQLLQFSFTWECFYFHFSEAARYYPVESFICRSLLPLPGSDFDKITYGNEVNHVFEGEKNAVIDVHDDIYSVVKAEGRVDFEHTLGSPPYFEDLLKHHSNLSKSWYLKALTRGSVLSIRPRYVSQCHLRSLKSLRSTLAVLCDVNLDKIVNEWERKAGSDPRLTRQVFNTMKNDVEQLQAANQVLVPK